MSYLGDIIILPISAEDFIKELEGCIKGGDVTIDPLKLKKIWDHSKNECAECY